MYMYNVHMYMYMYPSEINNEYSCITDVWSIMVLGCLNSCMCICIYLFSSSLPSFLCLPHSHFSATASCANLNGTLQNDVSCAVDTTDSSTNNTALIAGLISGSLTLVVFLLLVIGCSVLAIKNKRKEKAVQCTPGM